MKNIAADKKIVTELVIKTNNELNTTLPRLLERKKLMEEEKLEIKGKAMGLVEKLACDRNFELNEFVKGQLSGYETRTRDIENEVLLIEDDLASLENEKINAELVQETLQDFFSVFDAQDVQKQKDMIRLVVKSIELSQDEIKIALFGKHPDIGLSDGKTAAERWCVQTAYWLGECASFRPKPGWAETEVYFRIIHVTQQNYYDPSAYREQTVEIALGPKMVFENRNIDTIKRRVPANQVIIAMPPPRGKPKPPRVPQPPRVVELLSKAIEWQGLLASGAISQAEIARREGISRTRITQITSLLCLARGSRNTSSLCRRPSAGRWLLNAPSGLSL